MAVDIGNFRLLVSTTSYMGNFTGYWHISIINLDGSSKPFEDRPVHGNFPTEDEAREAATQAGIARANELHEGNRIETYRND